MIEAFALFLAFSSLGALLIPVAISDLRRIRIQTEREEKQIELYEAVLEEIKK